LLYKYGILRRYGGIAKEYYAATPDARARINKACLKGHFCPQICLSLLLKLERCRCLPLVLTRLNRIG